MLHLLERWLGSGQHWQEWSTSWLRASAHQAPQRFPFSNFAVLIMCQIRWSGPALTWGLGLTSLGQGDEMWPHFSLASFNFQPTSPAGGWKLINVQKLSLVALFSLSISIFSQPGQLVTENWILSKIVICNFHIALCNLWNIGHDFTAMLHYFPCQFCCNNFATNYLIHFRSAPNEQENQNNCDGGKILPKGSCRELVKVFLFDHKPDAYYHYLIQ